VVIEWHVFGNLVFWGLRCGAVHFGVGGLAFLVMVMVAVELCFCFSFTGYPWLRCFVVLVIYMIITGCMQDLAELRSLFCCLMI
jgi:hypothetical protein